MNNPTYEPPTSLGSGLLNPATFYIPNRKSRPFLKMDSGESHLLSSDSNESPHTSKLGTPTQE